MLGTLLLANTLLELVKYFETYIYKDWTYATYLFIPIVFDTFLGIYKALRRGEFKWSEFKNIGDKLIGYSSILVLVHVLTSFTVDGEKVRLFDWVKVGVLSSLILKEGISILKHVAALNEDLVPIWLLDKLKSIDKTGKFKIDDNGKENDEEIS